MLLCKYDPWYTYIAEFIPTVGVSFCLDSIPPNLGKRMKHRTGREGRRVDPWKAKQKRFTRHITNLVRKGKVKMTT